MGVGYGQFISMKGGKLRAQRLFQSIKNNKTRRVKMRTGKRLYLYAIVAIAICLLAGFAIAPTAVNAATTKLKANKEYKAKGGKVYKISIPAEGYIKVKTKGKENSGWINLYDSDENKIYDAYTYYYRNEDVILPVSKGVYYLKYDREGSTISYSFIKHDNDDDNYCFLNAKTLKQKKYYSIYQTPLNNFDRYFLIDLKSSKKIRINVKNIGAGPSSRLYDKDFNEVNLDSYTGFDKEENANSYITAKLSKGKYYLVVSNDYEPYFSSCQVKWLAK